MEITRQHISRVRGCATDHCARNQDYSQWDECVSVGLLGLAESQARYEARRGASFWTYARYRVMGRIRDHDRRRRRNLQPALMERSFEEDGPDAPGHSLGEVISPLATTFSRRKTIESRIAIKELSSVVCRLLGKMDPTERFFIMSCALEGVPVAEASRRIGTNRHNGRAIYKRAKENLRQMMEELGYGLEDLE